MREIINWPLLWMFRFITRKQYRICQDGEYSEYMYYDQAIDEWNDRVEGYGYTELRIDRGKVKQIHKIRW